ncbi:MAG: hypothetical protein GC160_00380 [Acidobacteria bacterium]|nr:hypothetical protein [Acidobacteriota bacterium]
MSVQRGLGAAYTPNYTIQDINKMTQPPTKSSGGSGFRKTLGAVVGGVGNLVAPGLGSAIGNVISGGSLDSTGLLGSESTQFLEMQRQMQMENRAFETASVIMKNRHDAAMSAIRNMKS